MMKSTKTLKITAVDALTICAGAAMAQSQVPSSGQGDYWQQQSAPRVITGQTQSGSSDVETGYPAGNYVPFHGDYSTLANPG
jgi:hypothetical protein